MSVTLEMTDETEQAKMLIALGSRLKQKVLMAAWNMRSDEDRAKVLVSVAQYFGKSKREAILTEVLEKAKRIDSERRRAKVLAVLADYLPQEVFDDARNIDDERVQAEVFVSLFSFFPEEIRVLAEKMDDRDARLMVIGAYMGHEIVESLKLKTLRIKEDKDYALEVLEEVENIIERVLQIAQATQDEEFRAEAFKDFSIQSKILPQFVLGSIWEMILLHLSQRTRPQALADIAALMPVIYRLGGKKAVRDTFLVVQTLSTWWP